MMKMDQVLYRVGLDSEQEAEEQKQWIAEMRYEASRIDTILRTKTDARDLEELQEVVQHCRMALDIGISSKLRELDALQNVHRYHAGAVCAAPHSNAVIVAFLTSFRC